jgi:hypothetical protein
MPCTFQSPSFCEASSTVSFRKLPEENNQGLGDVQVERESVCTRGGQKQPQGADTKFLAYGVNSSMRLLATHSSLLTFRCLGLSVLTDARQRSSRTATIQGFACFEMFTPSLQKASASSWFASRRLGGKGGDRRSLYADALALGWGSGTLGAQVTYCCGHPLREEKAGREWSWNMHILASVGGLKPTATLLL